MKRNMKTVMLACFVAFCSMMMFGMNANAYIDPSVMTYLIQVIAGIVVAVGAVVGIYFRKAKKKVAKVEGKLRMLQEEQMMDEKYKEIARIHEKVGVEHAQFKEVKSIMEVLNSIMSYSVKDYDIDNIIHTNEFHGEVGEKMKELLCELRRAIPVLDTDLE